MSSKTDSPIWVKASERLPENTNEVFGKDDKGRKWAVFYTEGGEVPVDTSDGDDTWDYGEYKDEWGEERLKAGWYETCEQSGGTYDEIFYPRKIVEWLDESPKEDQQPSGDVEKLAMNYANQFPDNNWNDLYGGFKAGYSANTQPIKEDTPAELYSKGQMYAAANHFYGSDYNLSHSTFDKYLEDITLCKVKEDTPIGDDVEKEMDKAIRCLALELPEPIWKDVNDRWQKFKAKLNTDSAKKQNI